MKDEQKLLINLKRKKRGSLENVIDIYTPYVSVIVYNIIEFLKADKNTEQLKFVPIKFKEVKDRYWCC